MGNASDTYLRSAVLTATPEQLHLMLYDGAVRFARQGLEGMEKKDWEGSFNGFSRAQKIILEMLNSLNFDVDRSLCTRMAGLYKFIYRKLVEAGTKHEPAPAREAIELLEYQRETWVLLIEKLRKERAPGIAANVQAASGGSELPDAAYGALSVQG
jgi:flagellar secretion chaperone FliS